VIFYFLFLTFWQVHILYSLDLYRVYGFKPSYLTSLLPTFVKRQNFYNYLSTTLSKSPPLFQLSFPLSHRPFKIFPFKVKLKNKNT
jgi:hypothetical protein